MRILILYSSRFGQTKKIAEQLQQQLRLADAQVDVLNIVNAQTVDISSFDKIVIGASIRYGHYAQDMTRWIISKADELNNKPTAFFSVSILATKPHKSTPQTHSYTRKFFQRIPWHPQLIGIFAGELDYAKYNFADRYMMKIVMKLNGGETNSKAHIEFTDWAKVRQFGEQILNL